MCSTIKLDKGLGLAAALDITLEAEQEKEQSLLPRQLTHQSVISTIFALPSALLFSLMDIIVFITEGIISKAIAMNRAGKLSLLIKRVAIHATTATSSFISSPDIIE